MAMIVNIPEELKDNKITPKYQQVVDCIQSKIKNGELRKGEKLPSIFELSAYLNVSKDTVEKAYHQLNIKGITASLSRRGYFVINEKEAQTTKILFIVGELNYESKMIYEMLSNLDVKSVELISYCYKSNQNLLESIFNENFLEIDFFMFSPDIQDIERELPAVVKNIPEKKLLFTKRLSDNRMVQCCFHGLDIKIAEAFMQIHDRLKNYTCFNLILPLERSYYFQIIKGFQLFCEEHNICYKVLDGIEKDDLKTNESYFVLNDQSLSDFIGFQRELNFNLMEDVGLISLQDAPFKKYLAGGITCVSLDMEKISIALKARFLANESSDIDIGYFITNRDSI